MLRSLLFAGLLVLPTAALACECDDPASLSPAEREERARFYAEQDFILAEVERVDRGRMPFEPLRYRVLKPLSGDVPKGEILIYPRLTKLPDGSWIGSPGNSCSYSGTIGIRKVMAFIRGRPPTEPALCGVLANISDSGLMVANMCVQDFLDDPGMVQRIRALTRVHAGSSRNIRAPLSPSSSR